MIVCYHSACKDVAGRGVSRPGRESTEVSPMTIPDGSTESPQVKLCRRCGQVFPLSEFYRDAHGRFGVSTNCRSCTRARSAEWHRANKDRAYATQRAAIERDPERARRYKAEWRQKNHERVLARDAAYRAAHRPQLRAHSTAWARKYPERVAEIQMRRRARVNNAPVVEHFTREEIYERDAGRCHVCGRKVNRNHWHLDHLVPLSLGGEHSRRNVAVACPTCNLSRYVSGPAQPRLFA